jgi:hypothetical protein
MRIVTSLLTLAVAVLLVSCSTSLVSIDGKLLTTTPCFKGNCFVPVTVDACADGGISTPTDAVTLGGPSLGRTRGIIWIIVTRGYRFANQGLDVKGDTTFFGSAAYLPSQRTVMASDVNVTAQNTRHPYGLRIEKLDGTSCPEFDPFVIE